MYVKCRYKCRYICIYNNKYNTLSYNCSFILVDCIRTITIGNKFKYRNNDLFPMVMLCLVKGGL